MQKSQNDAIRSLLRALDMHSSGEGDHAERVSVYATATAEKMGMSDEELINVRRASELHDVGKVHIDSALLDKAGKLTEEEIATLHLHSILALRVIESFEYLAPCVPMIKHHHERWDGGGYPDSLKGEDIPLGARIIAVSEAFDVMCFVGPNRKSDSEALDELERCSGTQFDPAVVTAFRQVQPLIQPLVKL
ncbi:MAG: HD domain-containing protein [Fimbriimonadaceae bacterium]|nr:HD domain-containing protein [Fimbriimonadaceae bacterium]